MAAHVLVVDDDADVREMVELCVWDAGYRVVTAANGREALAQIDRERPFMVLLDLQMPVMQGFEVLVRLREVGSTVPVVFMSGGLRVRAEAREHRADGYLAKPFHLDHLIATVARFAHEP